MSFRWVSRRQKKSAFTEGREAAAKLVFRNARQVASALVFKLGQFACQKLDLIGDARITVEQYNILTFDPAAAALGAVAGFAQKLLGAHLNIALPGAEDEFLKTSFLFVLRRGH